MGVMLPQAAGFRSSGARPILCTDLGPPKRRLYGLQSRDPTPGGARRPATGPKSPRGPTRGWVGPSRPPAFPPSPRRQVPWPGAAMLGARAWLCCSLLLPRAGRGLSVSRRYWQASGQLRRALRRRGPRPGFRALVLRACPATPLYLTPPCPSRPLLRPSSGRNALLPSSPSLPSPQAAELAPWDSVLTSPPGSLP